MGEHISKKLSRENGIHDPNAASSFMAGKTNLLRDNWKIVAYLVLNEELNTLDRSSSGFRDGSRHTTHYDTPSVSRSPFQPVFRVVSWYWLLSSISCSGLMNLECAEVN